MKQNVLWSVKNGKSNVERNYNMGAGSSTRASTKRARKETDKKAKLEFLDALEAVRELSEEQRERLAVLQEVRK